MGMYENKEKIMLVCVVRKREIHKIMEIVEETDKKAFMWIGDAREVLGEGFVNIAYSLLQFVVIPVLLYKIQ